MKPLKFTTKAQTLIALTPVITSASILPLLAFTTRDFADNPDSVILALQKKFTAQKVIVRSSCIAEDQLNDSGAGKYLSLPNIDSSKKNELGEAIQKVITSYPVTNDANEFFVQPMLTDVKMAGVAFTCDINTGAPYYIINYDESGRTDTVTGGKDTAHKNFIIYKNSPNRPKQPYITDIINLCRDCEEIFANDSLDIEFALDKHGNLFLLQVRPLLKIQDLKSSDFEAVLNRIHSKTYKLMQPHPNLLGSKNILGLMPDWNPAEIIGHKPKKLALSLYKDYVTDSIWAYQRDNYGYRNLRSHPLMVSLMGVPYIDVRVSFNSFVPKELDDSIAARLIDYYIDSLEKHPDFHDKVEFEIVHSCYHLNSHHELNKLKVYGFSDNDIQAIKKSLLRLTNSVIHPHVGHFAADIKKIETLQKRLNLICNSDLPLLDKIYWLTEDCKRYGTLPFAGIARAAFIAMQFLNSFVATGIISENERELFLASLSTVAKGFSNDVTAFQQHKIKVDHLIREYGHLRPGTYDITSPRYDENPGLFFSPTANVQNSDAVFDFTKLQIARISQALLDNHITIEAERLIVFMRRAIEERETAKFTFTRSLSKVLQLLVDLGRKFSITRDDMAFVDFNTVKNMYADLENRDVKTILEADISKNKELYRYTQLIRLPRLISTPDDIYHFIIEAELANFITLKRITADTIQESSIYDQNISGKIVFVQSADPGYDFLLAKNIAGLITEFGGANSHMAIRCAEKSIPAVIGAGTHNFTRWAKAKMLDLDCANKLVTVIK